MIQAAFNLFTLQTLLPRRARLKPKPHGALEKSQLDCVLLEPQYGYVLKNLQSHCAVQNSQSGGVRVKPQSHRAFLKPQSHRAFQNSRSHCVAQWVESHATFAVPLLVMALVLMMPLQVSSCLGQTVQFPSSNPIPSSVLPPSNPFNAPVLNGSPITGTPALNGTLMTNPSAGGMLTTPNSGSVLPPVLPNGTVSSVLPPPGATVLPNGFTGAPVNNPAVGGFVTSTFDPYAPAAPPTSLGSPIAPSSPSLGTAISNFFGFGTTPQTVFQNPSIYGPQTTGVYPSVLPPTYPNSIYPNQAPPTLFPNSPTTANPYNLQQPNGAYGYQSPVYGSPGLFGNWASPQPPNNYGQLGTGWFNGVPNGPLWNGQQPVAMRFFQGPRFRHTWVYGNGDPDSLEVNDTDVSLAFAIPTRFSTQPIYLLPSFSIHQWDGPKMVAADLPGSAYSAFLDIGWDSDPMQTFGLETGIRLGVFTDFDTFNSDSFRILGKLIGRVRLTPTATLRAGAFYVNRNRYKIVPAGGILWLPNPDTRFDVFFPEPKLAHYLTTIGTMDTWWYVTGNYGGGSWTITREGGMEDRVDLNEIRLLFGLEFGRNEQIRQGRHIAFIEGGYAFNREILYKLSPADNIDVQESFVFRVGVGY